MTLWNCKFCNSLFILIAKSTHVYDTGCLYSVSALWQGLHYLPTAATPSRKKLVIWRTETVHRRKCCAFADLWSCGKERPLVDRAAATHSRQRQPAHPQPSTQHGELLPPAKRRASERFFSGRGLFRIHSFWIIHSRPAKKALVFAEGAHVTWAVFSVGSVMSYYSGHGWSARSKSAGASVDWGCL